MKYSANHASRLVRVAIIFAVVQLGLHGLHAVTARDPRLLGPHLVAWLHDLALLGILVLMLLAVDRMVRKRHILRRYLLAASTMILFAAGMSLSIYPRLLTEFMAFPVNIFRADGATTQFFVRDYLGWRSLVPMALPFVLGLWAARTSWQPTWSRKRAIAALPLLVLAAVTLLAPSPQPIAFGMQQIARSWLSGAKRAVPSLMPPSKKAARPLPLEPSPLESARSFHYDHVILCVIEGITGAQFETEFLAARKGFWDRVKDESITFTNYHTTNLDSYTSLIAMLTSIQVPYRAYANPGRFDAVNDAPNLAAALRGHGFQTLFVSTCDFHPFVPVRDDWHRELKRGDLPESPDWISAGNNAVESAVEDRAAISTIVEFVKTHDRTFVMHEMIFGHSPEWIVKTGKHPAEYCGDYLSEVLDALDELGLAGRTLFVVTADHGDRAQPANPENYRVPLFLAGPGIEPGTDARFLSHLDFQRVVGHYLSDLPLPESRDRLTTVGSTESWTYGEITARGDYQFIDNTSGVVLARRGQLDPATLHYRFQDYLDEFEDKLGQSGTLRNRPPSD